MGTGSLLKGSVAWNFSENNNRVIGFQAQGGDPKVSGNVTIEYFAHSAFRITSPSGLSMLIDPWRNDPAGAWGLWFPEEFPEVYADIVLSTHAHFDHDAVHRVHAPVTLERPVGAFLLGDVKIEGFGDKHMYKAKGSYLWTDAFADFGIPMQPDNPMHLDNSIIQISTGGLRIAHWGDNRPDATEFVLKALEGVDVLFLPIDGSEHILTKDDITALLARIKPKVVVPMHYLTKGAVAVLSTLQTPDYWLDAMPEPLRLKEAKWTVNPSLLEPLRQQAASFDHHYLKMG
jgi:L-ascorbate metabolism protein UlaG (beta-lactamase superfamily)